MSILLNPVKLAKNAVFYCYSASGRPATDISKDSIPASSDDEKTTAQFTLEITAEVPIVAIAVCATVLNALVEAALNHFTVISSPPIIKINASKAKIC